MPFVWAEELPDQCPPSDSETPNGESFYRMVVDYPPVESDFFSQRKINLTKLFKGISECQARSVSLFSDLTVCKVKHKLPAHKDKKIVRIRLSPNSGLIKKTAHEHFSWWRDINFDFITASELVEL